MLTLKNVSLFCLMVAIAFGTTATLADEPPPLAPDPISLDRLSPSVVNFGNTPGDIYGEVIGAGAGGWDVGGPGPVLHILDASYGLLPAQDNNDGHSNGELDPGAELVIYFSGDQLSVGMPGTHYDHQAVRVQAAGDRFVTNGAALPPVMTMSTGAPATIGVPAFPGAPVNLLSANQTRYNEIPTIGPAAFNMTVSPIDDMDALELTPFDRDQNGIHTIVDTPVYFSLDPLSPSLATTGNTAADILVTPPGAGAFATFAPAPSLGLSPADDVDALVVWDMDHDLVANPIAMMDFALFSLAPGSPYLAGPDGVVGSLDDFSAADIFVTDFSGVNFLYLPAAAIGMQFGDNVDALDVEIWLGPQSVEIWDEVPEPSTILLLVAGVAMLGVIRRRKK